jgi:ABC-type sulfate/molybdate transport systems ATPase subunit
VLLDDPLEALDEAMRGRVLAWIGASVEGGATVVVSTHEITAFARWETARVRLEAGRPVA